MNITGTIPSDKGRDYFAGLKVTKRNKATVSLTLTSTPNTNSDPNHNPYPNGLT
jgi:predicted component of type VI protein secretion system